MDLAITTGDGGNVAYRLTAGDGASFSRLAL